MLKNIKNHMKNIKEKGKNGKSNSNPNQKVETNRNEANIKIFRLKERRKRIHFRRNQISWIKQKICFYHWYCN